MANSESVRFTISTQDQYCRYLDVKLPLYPCSPTVTGLFGQHLKDFGIVLPYKISAYDLVFSGILTPSLYVELPVDYFESLNNFPELTSDFSGSYDQDAAWHKMHIRPSTPSGLNDLLHPYDYELKEKFVEKFCVTSISEPHIHNHKNGREFIAAEAYLPFWHIYALANSYYRYRFAESLMNEDEGRKRVMEILRHDATSFTKEYSDTFERVSWYKTIISIAYESRADFSNGEIFDFSQKYSKADIGLLKEDLKKLMRLYSEWSSQIKKHGCSVLQNACDSLTQDIYYICVQLQFLGCSSEELFDKFKYESRSISIMSLHEILDNEKYLFKEMFTSYGKHYCSEVKELQEEITDSVYYGLYDVEGFDAWIRAFNDIHKNLNRKNKPKATFNQFRIIDSLIIITIRTEIVLRELFRSSVGDNSNEDMKKLLSSCVDHVDDFSKCVLSQVIASYEVTNLKLMPQEIFAKIDEIDGFKKWSKGQVYCFKAILKFVTARNYFAHHAYKDSEINTRPSSLAGEIIKASVVTLLFINKHKV